MSRCLIRVENDTAAADIDAARAAADSLEAEDDYRTAMLDAMAARDAGQDPGSILRAFWRGAFIAGHLAATGERRADTERLEREAGVLGALLELTGGKR